MAKPSHERMYQEIVDVSDEICSEWEIDFLDSIEGRILRGTLSDKQKAVLERIYEKACKSRF
jgi:hypothetical protein